MLARFGSHKAKRELMKELQHVTLPVGTVLYVYPNETAPFRELGKPWTVGVLRPEHFEVEAWPKLSDGYSPVLTGNTDEHKDGVQGGHEFVVLYYPGLPPQARK